MLVIQMIKLEKGNTPEETRVKQSQRPSIRNSGKAAQFGRSTYQSHAEATSDTNAPIILSRPTIARRKGREGLFWEGSATWLGDQIS